MLCLHLGKPVHSLSLMLDSTHIVRKYPAVFGPDEDIYYFNYSEGGMSACFVYVVQLY